ncbi:hypothetical protein, partial [Vibrio sp. 10N.222.54.B11]|uniref:hypothetical protein n=1 Tax=Vibrio sp. 10N.222.54.B11 TaxID=3229635 RepID=UPI00354D603C
MKKKLVLHIGMPKSGTSSIQRFLVQNVTSLQKNDWDFIYSNSSGNYIELPIYFAPNLFENEMKNNSIYNIEA